MNTKMKHQFSLTTWWTLSILFLTHLAPINASALGRITTTDSIDWVGG